MAKKAFEVLTESMYYILMAFSKGEMCSTQVAQFVEGKTRGRVKLGPGTVYTVLMRFEEEKMIEEIARDDKRRVYRITEKGMERYQEKLSWMRACVLDSEEAVQ